MPRDFHSSPVQSWYISLQHELRRNMLLDVAYVGNRADDLLLFANYNQAAPNNAAGTIPLANRRPIAGFADITYAFNGGKSRYKALQTKFEWRVSRDVTVLSSLTLSETKDNGSQSLENANGNFPAPQDFRNLDADFGLSEYHQPYNSTTSFVWTLPFGRGQRWGSDASAWCDAVIGGWQLAGVNRFNAGEPVTFTYAPGATFLVSGITSGLPRREQLPRQRQLRSVRAGRRPDDHELVQPGLRRRRRPIRANPFGNADRNNVRGPRFWQLDHGDLQALRARRAGPVRVPVRGVQPAEQDELPRAERRPQRRRVRHDHRDPRSPGSSSSGSSSCGKRAGLRCRCC